MGSVSRVLEVCRECADLSCLAECVVASNDFSGFIKLVWGRGREREREREMHLELVNTVWLTSSEWSKTLSMNFWYMEYSSTLLFCFSTIPVSSLISELSLQYAHHGVQP